MTAAPDWPIADAAALMVKQGVRHVLVFDASDLVGILSMRDVVRVGGLAPLSRRPAGRGRDSPRGGLKNGSGPPIVAL